MVISRLIKFFLVLVFFTSVTFSSHAEEVQNYKLATATTWGTFYPVGIAISTVVNAQIKDHKIHLNAINSAGSGENIKLLRDKKVQFAILQGLYGYYAWKGEGPVQGDGPQKNLRSMTMLWKNVEHFVVNKKHVKSGTISDLLHMKGAAMAMGKLKSGTLGSNRILLKNLGIDIYSNYKLVHKGYGPSADALIAGNVDGIGMPAGAPAVAVKKVMKFVNEKTRILSFTESEAKKADGGLKLWTPYTIKAGTYPGQTKDIQTISQPNFLAVDKDMDDEVVYKFLKMIYTDLPFLQSLHKATLAMNIRSSIDGLPVPLHPGAVKFYKEAGLKIPDHLIVK